MKPSSNTADMTKGSPVRLILTFSIPLIIGNIFQQLYNMVDTVVVGNFVGSNALGAVGACGSISWLFFSLSSGLALGIGIIVSQNYGAKQFDQVRATIANSFYVLIFTAIVVSVVCYLIAPAALRLLKTPEDIIDNSIIYMRTTCLGIVAITLYNGVSSILQALGNSKIDVSYRKDSFAKGDIRPEHYFDCEDLTNGQVYSMSSKTGDDSQDIEYTINFSQNLKVNSRATDVLSYNIGRDLDDLVNSLSSVMNIEEKISRLKDMKNSDMYAGQTDELESMIEAANKELDYAKNNMEALFAKGITQMKGYQSTVNTELSDVGSREVRLTLTKTRLTQQQTTFKDLKSKNEDVELEDIAVDFAAAETVYNAAIATASKTVRQSLLDYL